MTKRSSTLSSIAAEPPSASSGVRKPATAKIPQPVLWGLAVAIALDTATQLTWKSAIAGVPAHVGLEQLVPACLSEPLFLFAMLLFIPKLVNWLWVLRHADLSYAKPVTALSIVSVTVFSALILKETVTVLQALGIALIVAGVWLIGRAEHASTPEGSEVQ